MIFTKTYRLDVVVLPSLNASSALVRSEAIRLLGSAAQSNTAVQIAALESGSIEALLRVLVLDQDPTVRSRALYALSCLVRRFPTALIKMVAGGGLEVLATLFQSETQDNLKLQVNSTLPYDHSFCMKLTYFCLCIIMHRKFIKAHFPHTFHKDLTLNGATDMGFQAESLHGRTEYQSHIFHAVLCCCVTAGESGDIFT
jgi:hypothetical protein